MASIGSQFAPHVALDRTVSAIASARRAVLADRYAINSFAVEWRWLADVLPIASEWRELAGRSLEPNIFYDPGFALAAAAVFGNDVGAILVWSGTSPRRLLGFFPARVIERRYGMRLPILLGWTHPYGPLGTPLVDRDAAEPVIAALLAHIAADASLPGLLLLPLLAEDEPFALALCNILQRTEMPCADFARHHRALLAPRNERTQYLENAVSAHRQRELRRTGRRLADTGALLFTTASAPEAVAAAAEDFFAIEAAGWKGEAGTAAAHHDDVIGFIRMALPALATEGKVAINRLLLDGRPVAAAITLFSGNAAWYWKTAYDEHFARFAPGMLLSAALTEELADNAAIGRTDSCAAPGNTMLDHIWSERLTLCNRLIAVRPEAPFGRACRLETLRGAIFATARSVRNHLRD
ncbi:MAG TPA: GNAT family N-acetyltransferase [Xanthobacteraceae bacterium]|nr:GNAT family N-acetyltransferase [Xanthobacteraceae bacterium]